MSPRSAFAILAHVGSDCAGAVQFLPAETADELDTGTLEPLSIADVAQMLRDLRTDPHAWQQPAAARGGHFSLAGAQTKFALHRTAEGWARPSDRIPTTHIFKPAIPGIAHHDLNEHLCLRAAQRLGLLVASSELARFEDERVLVVQRYDRRHVDGELRRLHQVDMCQALGVMPELPTSTSTSSRRRSPATNGTSSTRSPTRLGRWTSKRTSERSWPASPMRSPSTCCGSSAADCSRRYSSLFIGLTGPLIWSNRMSVGATNRSRLASTL